MPGVWLSRSWTTRPRRQGEAEDAYVFVTDEQFRRRVADGGFLEWAEFLGHLYGTPVPHAPPGDDVLLEIDVQGAEQVLEQFPTAVVVLLLPPSPEVQRSRLEARGDASEHIERRLRKGLEEVARGRKLARYEVVNTHVDQAVDELAGIVSETRRKDLHGS